MSESDLRRFDSPTARRLEAWLSLERDLLWISLWTRRSIAIFETLERPPPGEVATRRMTDEAHYLHKALWDASLVALFRHYGNAPVSEIPKLYNSVAREIESEEGPGIVPSFTVVFERWRRERSHRIAHAVGVYEGHQTYLRLDEDTPVLLVDRWHRVGGDSERLLEFAERLAVAVTEEESHLRQDIKDEIGVFTPEELRRLPPYSLRPHGRRFGA